MRSKQNFFRSLAVLVVGLMCFSPAVAGNSVSGMVGDVNHDGHLSIADVTTLINTVLTDGAVTDINDINGDHRVSISDVTMIIDGLLRPEQGTLRFVVNGYPFEMVIVEGGTFNMGATAEQESEALFDEYPVHEVTLSTYCIGQTPVTQELWLYVLDELPSAIEDQECPVETVSWYDCQRFIETLNEMTGCQFRLPTEAEWEFAARGGNYSHNYKYSGSDDYDEVAWCELNSGDLTQRVGYKKANELGIYDMSGNVWEWCQDWWDVYSEGPAVNPTGPETGSTRVCRGGCMRGHVRFCRVSCRMDYSPNTRRSDLGLRLAM